MEKGVVVVVVGGGGGGGGGGGVFITGACLLWRNQNTALKVLLKRRLLPISHKWS